MYQPKPQLGPVMAGLNALRRRAEAAFAQVQEQHPQAIACGNGCDDCCHAVFDLAPVEALAIGVAFSKMPRKERREAVRRARKAAAAFEKVMRLAITHEGEDQLHTFSTARVRCPLLRNQKCLLYEQRPITCRLYGAPVEIEGIARVCSRTGFKKGGSYPTVKMGRIQAELDHLSRQAIAAVPDLPTHRRDVARILLG